MFESDIFLLQTADLSAFNIENAQSFWTLNLNLAVSKNTLNGFSSTKCVLS